MCQKNRNKHGEAKYAAVGGWMAKRWLLAVRFRGIPDLLWCIVYKLSSAIQTADEAGWESLFKYSVPTAANSLRMQILLVHCCWNVPCIHYVLKICWLLDAVFISVHSSTKWWNLLESICLHLLNMCDLFPCVSVINMCTQKDHC